MTRVVLALPVLAVLVAVGLPGAEGRPEEPGVCDLMTPSKMLENPGIARQFAQALRSGDSSEIARVRALLSEIRAAHGCEGEVALPPAPRAPALPPGHPPIDGRAPRVAPFVDAPAPVTI